MNMINQIAMTAGILCLWMKQAQNNRMHQKQVELILSEAVRCIKTDALRTRKKVMIEDAFYTDRIAKELDENNVECIRFQADKLTCFEEFEIDAVIMSVEHKELSAVQMLRSRHSNLLIIGCTETESFEDLKNALNAGMDGTIAAPLSAHQLTEIVCKDSI